VVHLRLAEASSAYNCFYATSCHSSVAQAFCETKTDIITGQQQYFSHFSELFGFPKVLRAPPEATEDGKVL
jgi:hypothetical protein